MEKMVEIMVGIVEMTELKRLVSWLIFDFFSFSV